MRRSLLARLNADDNDTTHLRSFLDLGSRRRGWRKTTKGSGKFSWNIHTHNSLVCDYRDLNRLLCGANKHFLSSPEFRRHMLLTRKVTVIYTAVSINGTDWDVGNICEYVGYVHITFIIYTLFTLFIHCLHMLGMKGPCVLVRFACTLSSGTDRTQQTRRQAAHCLFKYVHLTLMAFLPKTVVEDTHFVPTLSRAYGRNVGYM
jgi:hypothetical protein